MWIRMPNLFAVSPDGRRLAFVARSADGRDSLSVRSLSEPSAVTLPGTEGAAAPFWSPDSRFIAFFADRKLKKIDSSGGPPVTLCDVPSGAPSGSWGSQHSILFAASRGSVHEPRRGGRRRSQSRSEGGCLAAREGHLLAELPSRWPPLPLPGEEPDREAARSPSGEHRGRQDGAAPDELFARAVRAGRSERPRRQPIRVSALRARREPAGTAIRQPAAAACGRRISRWGRRSGNTRSWAPAPSRLQTTVFSPARGGAKPGAAGLDRPGRPGDGFRRPGRRIRIGATLSRLPKGRRQPCRPAYGLERRADR